MPPRVVFAIQSPTLLNILATSERWRLEVADFGDAKFAELDQLQAPRWDGRKEGVELVFVCSPEHRRQAREALPGVRQVVVSHQGYLEKVLPIEEDTAGVLTFSTRNARQLGRFASRFVYPSVIQPAYEPKPRWQWVPRIIWTAMSRLNTRRSVSWAGIDSAFKEASVPYRWFGEGQPDGYLPAGARDALIGTCSAHVAVYPPASGFGLTPHECWAAGCPVVGASWGDIENIPGLYDYFDSYAIGQEIDRVATDERRAVELSEAGLEYITKGCSRLRMILSIERALDDWL